MTDVFEAVASGDVDRVGELLRVDRSRAGARREDGLTVVLWALFADQPVAAKLLAYAKRDLDVFETAALGDVDRLGALLDSDTGLAGCRTVDGYTPLHLTAYFGSPHAARRLITAAADVDAEADDGSTPLHTAVERGHTEVIRVLLDAGARTEARRRDGATPLRLAAAIGRAAAVDLLLGYGAGPLDDVGSPSAGPGPAGGDGETGTRMSRRIVA